MGWQDDPVATPAQSGGAASWQSDPLAHPETDWTNKLTEDKALAHINSLPEEQQEPARNSWARAVVDKTWAEHPETNAADEASGRFSEYLPGVGSWLPRLAGAYRYATGHSYEMGKAL